MYRTVVVFICEMLRMMSKLGSGAIKMTRDIVKSRTLPGPKGVPILGNMLQMDMGRVQHEITNFSKTFGKMFKLSLLGKNIVVISNAKLLEKAFTGAALGSHLNDRSENVTKHVYYGRKHIGLANLSPETVSLRNILRHKVLQTLLGQGVFEGKFHRVFKKYINQFVKESRSQDVNPDDILKEFLTDMNSLIVSVDLNF